MPGSVNYTDWIMNADELEWRVEDLLKKEISEYLAGKAPSPDWFKKAISEIYEEQSKQVDSRISDSNQTFVKQKSEDD